jgi:ribosome-associated translation inhibitor RaiA
VQELVERRVAKLDQFASDIMSCHVAIRTLGEHHHQGHVYQARIDLRFRGEEIFAGDHHGHEDVAIAVRDAFDAIERKLNGRTKRRRDQARRLRAPSGSAAASEPPLASAGADDEPPAA